MFDNFEKIFVVNLAQRVDRRRETEVELGRTGGLRAEFFPAIRPESAGKFGSIGEHGCFMSHFTLLKNSIGLKNLLILEDDINFSKQFARNSNLVDLLPLNWDIFYGGYNQLPDRRQLPAQTGLVEVEGSTEFIGTHCYAVNGPTIPKLVKAYELFLSRERGHKDGGPMPVDGAMNLARNQLNLRTFVAIPPLAFQRSSRTDVGHTKWFDNTPAIKSVVQTARRIKNMLR